MFSLLLSVFIIFLAFRYWLLSLNLRYLKVHGQTVPPEFSGEIDPGRMEKISAYTFENTRAGIVESIISNLVIAVFLFGGLLGVYDRWIASTTGTFLGRGLIFFLFILFAEILLDMPFSLYRNFKIENRYGFNTMTGRIWITDLVKSAAISSLLGGIVVISALAIVQASPSWWWLWVWAFFLTFGIFVMYVSPYVIEPLFFKFEPIKTEGLEDRVRELMERAGLKVSRVFQVDASSRSRHSNAYFTGIGKVKRIVLFDTLIGQMSQDEILAVLAHEVGHWKKRHVLKGIIVAETLAFCGVFLAYLLVSWDGLPALMNLPGASFYARIVMLAFIGSLFMFPLTPLLSSLSRRYEAEADRFAADLTGHPDALASALVKLSRENLSNLHPHPFYARFYYSHPPMVERIRKLRSWEVGKVGK